MRGSTVFRDGDETRVLVTHAKTRKSLRDILSRKNRATKSSSPNKIVRFSQRSRPKDLLKHTKEFLKQLTIITVMTTFKKSFYF